MGDGVIADIDLPEKIIHGLVVGFPDDFTKIPYRNKPAEKCPDGPRYKALGNSMAVPVMRWIGERVGVVDAILKAERGEAA